MHMKLNCKLFLLPILALFFTFAIAQTEMQPLPASPDSPIVKKLLALPATDDPAQLHAVARALLKLGFDEKSIKLGEFIERQSALRMLGERQLYAATVDDAVVLASRRDDPRSADNLKRRIGSSIISVQRLTVAPGRDASRDRPLGDGFWGSRFSTESIDIFVEIRNLTDAVINGLELVVIVDPTGTRMEFRCHIAKPPPVLRPGEVVRAVCLSGGSSAKLAALLARTQVSLAHEAQVTSLSLAAEPVDLESRTDALLAGLTCADTGTCDQLRAQERRASFHRFAKWLPTTAALVAGSLILAVFRVMPRRLREASPRTLAALLAGMAIVLTADLAAWSDGSGMWSWIASGPPALLLQLVFATLAVGCMALVIAVPGAVAYPLLVFLGPLVVMLTGLAAGADGLALIVAVMFGFPMAIPLVILGYCSRAAVKSAQRRVRA